MRSQALPFGSQRVFRVATVDSAVIEQALRLPIADFEVAVTAAAALGSGCEFYCDKGSERISRFTCSCPCAGGGAGDFGINVDKGP